MSAKRIATVLGTLAAALGWLACSGGTEGPELVGAGPGPDESPAPSPPEGERSPTPPLPTGTVTSTGTGTGTGTSTGTGSGTGTGTGSCTRCQDVILQGDDPINMCTGADTAFDNLESCLCYSCSTDCASFCAGTNYQLDSTCGTCANSYCSSESVTCIGR